MNPVAHLKLIAQMRMATSLPAVVLFTIVGFGVQSSVALAQQGPATKTTPELSLNKGVTPQQTAAKPDAEIKPRPITKPSWADLTPVQHKALKPLADQWAQLSVESKRKWLAISKNFESLPSAEQAKLHSRMSDWVSLSPNERTEARLNFAETKKLPADEKAAHWQSYQELSAEEKRKLAAQAPAKPSGVAVIKPTPQKKLADVPITPHAPQQGVKLGGSNLAVNPNTLLPQRPASTEASGLQK